MVYARQIGDRTITFGVSGLLWNRSLVMYDVETNSHWSHILGRAMDGPLKAQRAAKQAPFCACSSKDTMLVMLPSEMTTWKEWLTSHPDTTVLNLPRSHKAFTRDFYKNPADFVFGWAAGRKRYHAGLDALAASPVRNIESDTGSLVVTYDPASTNVQIFSRTLDGKELHFTLDGQALMRDKETGPLGDVISGVSVDGPSKGKRLERRLGMISYRRAWNDFYPASRDALRKSEEV